MANKKEPRMSILAHLGLIGRPGSSVPKEKHKILEEADKKIQQAQKYKKENIRTTSVQEEVEKVTGKRPESGYDTAIREAGKAARKKLAALKR